MAARNGSERVKRWKYQADVEFRRFAESAKVFWPDLIDEDLESSWQFSWKKLDFEQKAELVSKLQARIDAGDDGRFVTRPPRYLEDGDWKRPPRQNGNGKTHPAAAPFKYERLPGTITPERAKQLREEREARLKE